MAIAHHVFFVLGEFFKVFLALISEILVDVGHQISIDLEVGIEKVDGLKLTLAPSGTKVLLSVYLNKQVTPIIQLDHVLECIPYFGEDPMMLACGNHLGISYP